jgi:hypothetical protein
MYGLKPVPFIPAFPAPFIVWLAGCSGSHRPYGAEVFSWCGFPRVLVRCGGLHPGLLSIPPSGRGAIAAADLGNFDPPLRGSGFEVGCVPRVLVRCGELHPWAIIDPPLREGCYCCGGLLLGYFHFLREEVRFVNCSYTGVRAAVGLRIATGLWPGLGGPGRVCSRGRGRGRRRVLCRRRPGRLAFV